MVRTFIAASVATLLLCGPAYGEEKLTRKDQVLRDKEVVGEDESWVYNDLEAGLAEAKRTGKAMLIVFRCIP